MSSDDAASVESPGDEAGFERSGPVHAAVNWRSLVDHARFLPGHETLDEAQRKFLESGACYMAVLDGVQVAGLCAGREIGMRLGTQYGYSLFAKKPVLQCMLADPLVIWEGQPWADVLQQVFSRTGERFNEDVVLLDSRGEYRGLISVQTLVRLQTRLLGETIAELGRKQAELSRRNRQMTDDLMMAREMQLALLPPQPLSLTAAGPCAGQLRVMHHYAPLTEVSGDFFEVLRLSDTALCVLIGDAMGHGVQAGLVTAMIRALVQDHRGEAADPGALLSAINGSLCKILEACVSLPLFASAFALVADLSDGLLRYANAGHPPPLLLRSDAPGAFLDCEGDSNGGLLGVTSEDQTFPTGRVRFAAGDSVLMFTDGLFEVRGSGDEILGLDGLLALAADYRPGRGLLEDLLSAVRRHSRHGEFEDDLCVVALEMLQQGPVSNRPLTA